MTERPQSIPLYEQLIEKVEKLGRVETTLTPDEMHLIFARQAEADESGDLPVLLPGFYVVIKQDELHLHASYTIDEDKKALTFDGSAKNNEKGILSETTPIRVTPDTLRDRVVDAFDGTLDLPNFIKLITEDALKGGVTVGRLFIDGDKLGMVLEKNTNAES